jgi:hypothetical protein
MRAILIELKRSSPTGEAGGGPEGLRRVLGAPAWENNRAAGWMILPGSPAPTHRHSGDAVELVFDGDVPKATFQPAGTVHAGPAAPPNGRAVIFEMK